MSTAWTTNRRQAPILLKIQGYLTIVLSLRRCTTYTDEAIPVFGRVDFRTHPIDHHPFRFVQTAVSHSYSFGMPKHTNATEPSKRSRNSSQRTPSERTSSRQSHRPTHRKPTHHQLLPNMPARAAGEEVGGTRNKHHPLAQQPRRRLPANQRSLSIHQHRVCKRQSGPPIYRRMLGLLY